MREGWGGAVAIVVAGLCLSGCTLFGTNVKVTPRVEAPKLPEAPTRLKQCFHTLTPIPVKNMTGKELTSLVAKLRQSEAGKSRCGRDLLAWYDTVRRSYGAR